MQYSIPTFNIELDKKNSPDSLSSHVSVVGKCVRNQIHVTICPFWDLKTKKEYSKTRIISADRMLILNLNHIFAYGHIYSEVFSELCAIDEKYGEYDCIVTMISPLMKEVIDSFGLVISEKLKFILSEEKDDPFLLKFNKLKIVNHSPNTYPDKVKNVIKLKTLFHTAKPIIKRENELLLYCSRNSPTAGHGRRLTQENETQIIEVLKQYASENNLEFCLLTGHESDGSGTPISKQYDLFSNAKLVVGLHGGVMSNLIFLDPLKESKIIEFCPIVAKSFNILFDGAILNFAKYQKILYQLSPSVKAMDHKKIFQLLRNNESTINLSELKMLLESE